MRHIFSSLLCFFFLLEGGLQAQNLIADPGFEVWDGAVGSPPETMAPLSHWYNANGTPDHHHVDNPPGNNLTSLEPCATGQGFTNCGFPYEGSGVLGCWKGNGLDGTREWAGTILTEPMVPGACYQISFWIQNKEDKPTALYETNQWGLFFSETPVPTFSANAIDYETKADQWVACSEVISGSDWQKVELSYRANEAYSYAYIGYMGNVSSSTYVAASTSPLLGFYVWFDEVSIERIDPQLTLTADMTICPGEEVLLEAVSNFPVIWDVLAPATTASWSVMPSETTTYYVETQDSTACAIRDSVTVAIYAPPVTNFVDLVCTAAMPFQLETPAVAGTWSGPGITEPAAGWFDPAQAGVGPAVVYFEAETTCLEDQQILIAVTDTPVIDLEIDVAAGCVPLAVDFSDLTAPTASAYVWDFGDGAFSMEAQQVNHLYTEPGVYDLNLQLSYSDYCTVSANWPGLIQASETPVAGFSYAPQQVSNLEPEVQFSAVVASGIVEWTWDFGDGRPDFGSQVAHEFSMPGTYPVELVVETATGCADTLVQAVVVENRVAFFVPNVFSPNDDGRNDRFEVYYQGELINFQLTIYDRWGGQLYQTSDPAAFWDGFDQFSQQRAPTGTYIYQIEYQYPDATGFLKTGVRAGDILLLR